MRALISTPREALPVALRDGLPEPVPAPNEAVVAVRAAGINRGELRLLAGRDGWGPGQDVAGEIAVAAADGSGPPAGTRVVALAEMGGWAERVAAATDQIAALPDPVSFAEAASLPVAGLTALRGLQAAGPILGRRILITGAAGGVGRFAVELAARGGAAAVAAVVRDLAARGAGLTAIGATQVVTAAGDAEGFYDLVLESVGGATLTAAVNKLAADGVAIVFGNSSNEPSALGFADLRGNPRRRIQGFGVYTSGPGLGADLAFLVGLVAAGQLHPQVGTPWNWREAPAALAALRDRGVNGKAILSID